MTWRPEAGPELSSVRKIAVVEERGDGSPYPEHDQDQGGGGSRGARDLG